MYINEVKRDNETLKKISEFQSSIENLVSCSFLINFCELRVLTAWGEKKMKRLGLFSISRFENKQMMVQSNKMSRREISADKR